MTETNKRLYMKFTGRVQGVGFRFFAQKMANSIGVTGEVRNCEDGSVEIYAEGDEALLNSFAAKFRDGPSTCRIDHIEKEWQECKNKYKSFKITK